MSPHLRRLLALLAVLRVLLAMAGGAHPSCDAAAAGGAGGGAAMPAGMSMADMTPAAAPAGHDAPAHRDTPPGDACVVGWHCVTAVAAVAEAPADAPALPPAGARYAVRATLPPGPVAEPESPPPRA